MTIENKKQIPAIEGLFTWPSESPALIGSRCKSCGIYSFPARFSCINPNCKDKQPERVSLSTKGKLWSYTIHYYQPPPPFKSPEPFSPFGIGVVELPEGLKVVGMLTVSDLDQLRIGLDMELVIDRVCDDDEGNELLTWKFAPRTGGLS